jgi:hypothetical protein
MEQERAISEKVRQYLQSIGYNNIEAEIETSLGMADLVVFEQGAPKIVVETKSPLSIVQEDEEKNLPYNPYVRRLQNHAKFLKSRYYILSDGKTHLWFVTDESGRPQKIKGPIVASEAGEEISRKRRYTKRDLSKFLGELWDIMYLEFGPQTSSRQAGVVILAKLMSERGLTNFDLLLQEGRPLYSIFEQLPERSLSELTLSENRKYLKPLYLLSSINLLDSSPIDLLSVIDQIFIDQIRRKDTIRLHRWVNDLLFKLSSPKNDDVILDLHSYYGDTNVAKSLNGAKNRLISIVQNEDQILWGRIQELILGEDENPFLIGDVPPYNLFSENNGSKMPSLFPKNNNSISPDCIICAPPFGFQVYSEYFHTQVPSEDAYLELAIRWAKPESIIVAIVPDRDLFAKSRLGFREYILAQARLLAVISLGKYLSTSGIRASILVLKKGAEHEPSEIFMAMIDEIRDKKDTDKLLVDDIPPLANLYALYFDWQKKQQISAMSNAWLVDTKNLDIENLMVDHYRLDSQLSKTKKEYALVPLRDLAEAIYRGSNLTLDTSGDLPVISPSSVRPNSINIENISYTKPSKLANNSKKVKAGDIVINAIGDYRGAAALVNNDLDNFYINRHIIAIQPIKSLVIPEFLALVLNGKFVKQQWESLSHGAVIPSLNIQNIRDIAIPLPSFENQQRVVENFRLAKIKWVNAQNTLNSAEQDYIMSFTNIGLEGE